MSKPLIIFAKTYQEAKDYASLWGLKRKEISYYLRIYTMIITQNLQRQYADLRSIILI